MRSSKQTALQEVLSALAALAVVGGSSGIPLLHFVAHPPDVSGVPIFWRGASAGGILFLSLSGAAGAVIVLTSWVAGRPLEVPDLRSLVLEHGLIVVFASLSLGTVIWIGEGLDTTGLLVLLSAAAFTVLFVGRALVAPWIALATGPRLEALAGYADLQLWVARLLTRHGHPAVKVRVQSGTVYNAFVLWRPYRPLLVVGRGLLDHLADEETRAVLAHEASHLVRRDPARVAWLALAGTLVQVLFAQFLAFPLILGGRPVLGGALLALTVGGVTALVGFQMRRMELRTDRLAVEMLEGQWEVLASALKALSNLKREPANRRGLTHPSVTARINRMKAEAGRVGGADIEDGEG